MNEIITVFLGIKERRNVHTSTLQSKHNDKVSSKVQSSVVHGKVLKCSNRG